jgi:hypothetical protein
VQPGDVVSGLVGRVTFFEVLLDQPDVIAFVEIRRCRAKRRRRILRFLDEIRDTVVFVDVDDPVLLRQLPILDVQNGDAAAVALAPERSYSARE